jgi:hypothetical protein
MSKEKVQLMDYKQSACWEATQILTFFIFIFLFFSFTDELSDFYLRKMKNKKNKNKK